METKDLDTAIAYFEEQSKYFEAQSKLSAFAAQVAKWLTELKDVRQRESAFELTAKTNAVMWAQQSQFACGFGSGIGMSSLMLLQ